MQRRFYSNTYYIFWLRTRGMERVKITQNYFWMQHKMDDKRSDVNTFLKLRHYLKIHNVEITAQRAQQTRFRQKTLTWFIFSSQDSFMNTDIHQSWINHTYHSGSLGNLKNVYSQFVFVFIHPVAQHIFHVSHSTGDILEQKCNHTPYLTKWSILRNSYY